MVASRKARPGDDEFAAGVTNRSRYAGSARSSSVAGSSIPSSSNQRWSTFVVLEHLRVHRARRERVVDAEHDVAERRTLRQHEPVDELARVPARLHLHLDPGLLREGVEGALAEGERVVSDEHERLGGIRLPRTL